jgi:predicted phage tail protein
MTIVNIHGILGREYGNSFLLSLPNPKDVLEAIDCNRQGFLQRLVELQREGLCYDMIINKKRITNGPDMDHMSNPATVDLVPAISGSGPLMAPLLMTTGLFTAGSTALAFAASIANFVLFAAISYALTPKPENEALEISSKASKSSLIFSNTANLASQGSPVPIGYGRLLVGSQVIQATIKSFPQHQAPSKALRGSESNPVFVGNRVL